LTHAKYEKLYIKWDNIHKLAYDNTAYQLLIENLRNLGFNKDADNCYYQFRVDQFQHWQPEIQDSLAYSIDGMAWISYGYGKKPHYPFIWSLIFIGFFGFFWRSMGLGTREWPPVARLKNGNNNNGKLLLHALAFSLTVFLSGTKLFIDPPNIPVLQGRWASIVRPAFIIERVLGAFFSILFFLAIGETIVG
jgi:hypothetical protein